MKIDEYLKDLPATRDETWFNNLDSRKKEEASFHDYVRAEEAVKGEAGKRRNLKFYKITQKSKAYVRSWLRKHVIGKVFLDYACGDGRTFGGCCEIFLPKTFGGFGYFFGIYKDL